MLRQPRLALLVFRERPADPEPELRRVLRLDQVGQLVDDDVVHDAALHPKVIQELRCWSDACDKQTIPRSGAGDI